MDLNRELRTDRENMIHLQDNVPATYSLNNSNDCAYFAFKVNYSLNKNGTIMIVFEATKTVMLIISSETRKPTKATTGRVILYSSDRYTPPKNETKEVRDENGELLGDF